jgi:hypothetical protein
VFRDEKLQTAVEGENDFYGGFRYPETLDTR